MKEAVGRKKTPFLIKSWQQESIICAHRSIFLFLSDYHKVMVFPLLSADTQGAEFGKSLSLPAEHSEYSVTQMIHKLFSLCIPVHTSLLFLLGGRKTTC